MQDLRLANLFYEQRGPLVFSASVHLALVVGVAIWALVSPDKDPVEFNFELVPPPAGGFAQATRPQPMEAIESVAYQRNEDTLPTLDDIVLPERPPLRVVVEMPPEPAPVERQQPVVEVAAAKPMTMSYEEYLKQNPDADKVKNVRTTPAPTARPTVDLTSDVAALKRSLSQFAISSLSSSEIESFSTSDQAVLNSYLTSFKAALKRNVSDHPIRGAKLSALISCDIAANGRVSNVRVIRSSGDSEFDQKVMAGYARILNFNPPPQAVALRGLQIEFIQ